MIVIYWKWKVWNWLSRLLSLLKKEYILVDDQDCSESILEKANIILVSPGIKQSHYIYQKYWNIIQSELQFLSTVLPTIDLKNPVWIWITATNWKSTTTWVMYKVLESLFPEKKVRITGNFDIPVSEVLATIIENKIESHSHIFVVECSSFMLCWLKNFIFDYSILLNIAKDHLDRHQDFEDYKNSKLALLYCTQKKSFVPESSRYLVDNFLSQHTKKVTEDFDISSTYFIGSHNIINLSTIRDLIFQYCLDLCLDMSIIKSKFFKIISSVKPLPHRLSLLRIVDWISIYDDWICTSSHSLSAALSSFQQKVVLIAWWYDKWDDYWWLSDLFISKVWYAILIGQTSNKFSQIFEKLNIPYIIAVSLEQAVSFSLYYARQCTITNILFSPWSASFDMFKNVYDRVDQFTSIVSVIKS